MLIMHINSVPKIVAGWHATFQSHCERRRQKRLLVLDASSSSSSSIEFLVLEGGEAAVNVVLRANIVCKMRRLLSGVVGGCDSGCLKSAINVPNEDIVVISGGADVDDDEKKTKKKW